MHRNNANTDKFNTCNPAICLATHMWPHAIIKQTTQITLTQRQHSRYMAKLDFIVFMLPLLSLAIGYWHWIFSHLHIFLSPYAERRRTSLFVQRVSWVAPFYLHFASIVMIAIYRQCAQKSISRKQASAPYIVLHN